MPLSITACHPNYSIIKTLTLTLKIKTNEKPPKELFQDK